VFLSANLQAHSYTKRFPKGTAQRKNSEKGGGRVWVIGLYFRARAELDRRKKYELRMLYVYDDVDSPTSAGGMLVLVEGGGAEVAPGTMLAARLRGMS